MKGIFPSQCRVFNQKRLHFQPLCSRLALHSGQSHQSTPEQQYLKKNTQVLDSSLLPRVSKLLLAASHQISYCDSFTDKIYKVKFQTSRLQPNKQYICKRLKTNRWRQLSLLIRGFLLKQLSLFMAAKSKDFLPFVQSGHIRFKQDIVFLSGAKRALS